MVKECLSCINSVLKFNVFECIPKRQLVKTLVARKNLMIT